MRSAGTSIQWPDISSSCFRKYLFSVLTETMYLPSYLTFFLASSGEISSTSVRSPSGPPCSDTSSGPPC